jgi:glutamate 5-kinase
VPKTNKSGAAQAIRDAKTLVIKCGSALVVEGAEPAADRTRAIADDIARLRAEGKRVVLVSSGAVALGRGRLKLERGRRLDEKQAAAAVGQAALMQAWQQALAPHGIVAAQVLFTRADTEHRRGWLNARATVDALLRLGALPIVNENDTVATEEIRYGDNDRLAARTAQMVRADALVLLSDVDGLYDKDPRRHADATHVPVVRTLDAELFAMAAGPNATAKLGSGGMITKLQAAEIARAAGCATIIALGSVPHPIAAVEGGVRATLIAAETSPATAYKQWIAGHLASKGVVRVDAGALAALIGGKSLLPSGVTGVEGRFHKGDCVTVRDPDGRDFALGLINYGAEEAARLCGRRSAEIETVLGYQGPSELIHRDDLVRIERVAS